MIILANRKNLLTPYEKIVICKYKGKENLRKLLRAKNLNIKYHCITESDLKKPELNIVIGAIYLKIVLHEQEQNLRETAYRYLNGYYALNKGKNITEKHLNKCVYVIKLANINKTLNTIELC
jgi:tRNA A22 N-methylase